MLSSTEKEFYLCPGDELKALRQRIAILEKLLAQKSAEDGLRESVSASGELRRQVEHLTLQNRTLEAEISELRRTAAQLELDGMALDTNGLARFSSKRVSQMTLPGLPDSQQGAPDFGSLLDLMNKHVVSYQTQITNLQNEIKTLSRRAKKYEEDFETLTKEALKMAGSLARSADSTWKEEKKLEDPDGTVLKGVLSCFLAHQAFLMQAAQIFAKSGGLGEAKESVESVRQKMEKLVERLMGEDLDMDWDPDNLRVERAVAGFRAAINWGFERVQELEGKIAEAQATITKLNNEKNEILEIKFRQAVGRVDPKTLISPQDGQSELLQSELFVEASLAAIDHNPKSDPIYTRASQQFERRFTKSTDASVEEAADFGLAPSNPRGSRVAALRTHRSILGAHVSMKNELAEAGPRPSLIQSMTELPGNSFRKAPEPEKVSDITSLLVSQKPQTRENQTLKYLDEIDRKNSIIAALENELRGLRDQKMLPVLESENKMLRLKVQNLESEIQLLKKIASEERERLEGCCQELVHEVSETKLKFSNFVMESEDRIAAQGKRNKNLAVTVKMLEEKLAERESRVK